MQAKLIKADSGTTKYEWLCSKFTENEAGRDYPGEWVSCTDILLAGGESVFLRNRQEYMSPKEVDTFLKIDKEEAKLKNFILKNFDELKDVEEISPRDWDRVIEEKSNKEESLFKDVEKYVPENIAKLLDDDLFASRMIGRNIKLGLAPENALEIYVNSVEGDTTQLPESLTKYARKKGWLKGFE